MAWPPGSWHSNTVTFFFSCLALGDRQPPDSSGRGNLLPLFQFSFNPKQNPGAFFHFLVLFFHFLVLLFSFPGAFFVLLIVLLLVLFFVLLIALLLVLFFVLLIVLLLVLFFVLLIALLLVLFFSFAGAFFLCS